jgi:DNA-binding phage protein
MNKQIKIQSPLGKNSPRRSRPVSELLTELYADDKRAIGMLAFALEMIVSGDEDEAKHAMRSLIKGRLGFEETSRRTGIPARSINRMLSSEGNPSLSNLTLIIRCLHEELGIEPNWTLKRRKVA